MNIRNFFIVFVLNLIFVSHSKAQCVREVNSFKPGEKITYLAYYNWGLIWIHAGDVEFTINSGVYENKPVYMFKATGRTVKSYDWAFKVRENFSSYVDKSTFQPLWHLKDVTEGSFQGYEKYIFQPEKHKVISAIENSSQPFKKDSLFLPSCTFDVLSTIYYCRTINFDRLKINDKIPISAIIESKIYSLYLRYLGKETIKNKDGHQYRCSKFSALLVEGTIFKGGEDMYVWITDDDNHIPVLVEAKILIGSVKAYLNTTEGLTHPLNALVK